MLKRSPPNPRCCCSWFQLPAAKCGMKTVRGKSRDKQFISFKLPIVLSSSRNLTPSPSVPPGMRVTPLSPSPGCRGSSPAVTQQPSLLSDQLSPWGRACVHITLVSLTAPEHKRSEAGSSDVPTRIWKAFPFRERGCSRLDKEGNRELRLLISTVRMDFLAMKL